MGTGATGSGAMVQPNISETASQMQEQFLSARDQLISVRDSVSNRLKALAEERSFLDNLLGSLNEALIESPPDVPPSKQREVPPAATHALEDVNV